MRAGKHGPACLKKGLLLPSSPKGQLLRWCLAQLRTFPLFRKELWEVVGLRMWQSRCWKACEVLWIQRCDFIGHLTLTLVQVTFPGEK